MRSVLAAILQLTAVLVISSAPAVAADRSLTAVPIADFRRLEISGSASVNLVHGDRPDLSVEASPETRARIRIENQDGLLSIQVMERKPEWRWHGGDRAAPRITITFRDLEALRLSGLIKVEAARIATTTLDVEAAGATRLRIGALQANRLRVEGAGAFQADIAGRVTEQHVEISGAGNWRAGDLVSDVAAVEVSGAGKVLVRAEKTLDVRVSGAGRVEYLGDPRVTQDVSGAARVRRRGAGSADAPSPAKSPIAMGPVSAIERSCSPVRCRA